MSRDAARELRRLGVRAVTDVSDGIIREAMHVADASGVDVWLERDGAVVDPDARAAFEKLRLDPVIEGLRSGEEYMLLAAVPGWAGRDHPPQQAGWRRVGRIVSPVDRNVISAEINCLGYLTSRLLKIE